MAFTWKPLESHRGTHIVHVPLAWHGDCCHTPCYSQGRGKKTLQANETGTPGKKQDRCSRWAAADCDCMDNRAKMSSIPAISHSHIQAAALFVFSLSTLYKFTSPTLRWRQTATQDRKCCLAAWRSPRFQPPTSLYQEKTTPMPEINKLDSSLPNSSIISFHCCDGIPSKLFEPCHSH